MENLYEGLKGLGKSAITYTILGAAALGLLGGNVSYKHEVERTKNIPLGFSEKTQIEEDAIANGKVVDPVTRYLTGVNDFSMKVFEAWNDSWKPSAEFQGTPYKLFSYNLKFKYSNEKHHYKLGDLARELPGETDEVIAYLSDFLDLNIKLNQVNNHFSNAWTERHRDNYHTKVEVVTTSSTDSSGHVTTSSHLESTQVYDDTDHNYWYHRDQGEAAALSLEKLIGDSPKLHADLSLVSASKTNLEGRRVALESRIKDLKKGNELDDFEYEKIASTWRFGSVIYGNRDAFANPWASLGDDLKNWKVAKNSARDAHYVTSSHSHSGPGEYQVSQKALNEGTNLANSIKAVFGSVHYTKDALPGIDGEIKDLINLGVLGDENNNSEEELEKASLKLIEDVKKLYKSNFERGFDTKDFRESMVALFTMLGLMSGAAAGFGIGTLIENKFNTRNRFD